MRSPLRRALGYVLWQWRRRPPSSTSAEGGPAPDRLRALLASTHPGTWHVVLLADRASQWRVQRWLRTFFTDDIVVFAAGFRPSRTHQPRVSVRKFTTLASAVDALRSLPPTDLIVDLRRPRGTDEVQRRTWRALYPAVAEHGAYVHLDVPVASPGLLQGWARASSLTLQERTPHRGPTSDTDAPTGVRRIGRYAVHFMHEVHYLKVPDRRAASLATRTPSLHVDLLETLPPADVIATGEIHRNSSSPGAINLDATMHAPVAIMRHYSGPLRVLSHMALTHERTLLPPSFRYPTEPFPTNVLATDVDANFATLPKSAERALPALRGDFYDLTTSYHAHFGHFITEVPAKLWGWATAKEALPDLKALIRVPPGYEPSYERELLNAFGLTSGDVVWQPEAVQVSSWVACTSLWQNHEPYWFHPAIAGVWKCLREGLIDPARAPGSRRLFVSRHAGMEHRDCRNAAQVEGLFQEYGFEVVYPEEHSLASAATLFADARTVAGFGGSALFNVLFSERLRTLIVLNHEAYLARNEHLYATALGADSHYFWSKPDLPQTGAGLDPKAFQSPWEFDFARNETLLRTTLRELPDDAG